MPIPKFEGGHQSGAASAQDGDDGVDGIVGTVGSTGTLIELTV